MHGLISLWFGWVHTWGYLGIVILMAMESSIIPVPAEIVIPPAAFYIAEGRMSFWGVVLAGTIGSYLGSVVMYWVSRWLGRVVIVRFGKYFFLSEKKLAMAEQWVHRYEAGGVFFARLLPVLRHLISIPAGIVRMSFGVFSAVTLAGAFAWCVVLAYLGNKAHSLQPDLINDPNGLMNFVKHQSHWIAIIILALAGLYFLMLKLTAKSATKVTG